MTDKFDHVTEIIQSFDTLPKWASEAMEKGRLFSELFKRTQALNDIEELVKQYILPDNEATDSDWQLAKQCLADDVMEIINRSKL